MRYLIYSFLSIAPVLGLQPYSGPLTSQAQTPGTTHPLLAGTAKINITPASNEPLHDSVYARTLVLESGDLKIALVSVDLGIFTSERIQKVCQQEYGISEVLLCSSHTHSGPHAFQPGNPYQTFYEDQILKSIGQAMEHLFKAHVIAGRSTFPQLGFNRLIIRQDGHARESWYSDEQYTSENPERIPFGPVDPEVGVVRIDDDQGQPRVILMNYACHADIVCFNYAISADYPGVASSKVEEAFDHKVNCLFIQGAGGNIESLQISSRRKSASDPFQTDYAPMERTGEILAFQTVKLARSLGSATNSSASAAPGGAPLLLLEDSLHFTGRFNKHLDYRVHLSTILIDSTIAIAACPGELFVQLQLEWKKQMELAGVTPLLFGYTWSAGDWPGYVADVRSAALGGYGADQGSDLIEVGAGEAIITRQLENFYRLNGLMRDKPGPTGFKGGAQWIYQPFQAPHPTGTPKQ
jgi:neutral ceramidase